MGVVVDLVVNALVAGADALEILPPDGGCAGCKSECGKVLGRAVVVEAFDCGGVVAEGEELVSWLEYVAKSDLLSYSIRCDYELAVNVGIQRHIEG